MRSDMANVQPIAGCIDYSTPPPPNPPPNVPHHIHQNATIQHLLEPRQQAMEEEAFPPPRGYVPMIQRGRPTNRTQRKRSRQVFQAKHAPPATPEYLNWLEQPIGFDRSDHPLKIPRPGHHTLVLEDQIGGFTSKRVFRDGGRRLNLIYVDTLRKIKSPLSDHLPSKTSFHDIVPGKPTYPLGIINLDVIFGTPRILGRRISNLRSLTGPLSTMPFLGDQRSPDSCMAVPHYAYLKLRMPGNSGPLTISGSFA
jgi:hypothetical protein